MRIDVDTTDGGTYYAVGTDEATSAEYKRFRGCLAQLLDESTMVGDVEGKWIIFKDGWLFGMAAYGSKRNAMAFAEQIFRDESDPAYIIVQVNPEQHALSAMHLLASALSDVDSFDFGEEDDPEPAGGDSDE